MIGAGLKAWRDAKGLSQQDAADHCGVSRSAWASYESGRRPVPEEVAKAMEGEGAPPAPKAAPPPKLKGAAVVQLAAVARQEVKALEPEKRPTWAPKGARRPTAQEVEEFPHRFSGPNVWIVEHNPPKPNGSGGFVRLMILKGSATGHGFPSVHLVGKRGEGWRTDKEALRMYRPAQLSAPF